MKKLHKVVVVVLTTIVVCLLFLTLPRRTEYEKAQAAHHAETPLGQTAVRHYDVVLSEHPEITDALYQKATILDHGILQGPEPVRPNPVLAIGMYRQIAMVGTPREQALARDRLRELDDRLLLNPPPRRQFPLIRETTNVNNAADIVELTNTGRPRSDSQNGPRSDSQNVHDSSVVKSVKRAMNQLGPSPITLETTLVQVRSALSDDPDALKALDLMEKNTCPLAALKMTEVDVLRKVWGRIQNETREETRNDMTNMLKIRLHECGKDVSCASGRVARVVDSLSTFDDSVNLRPLWALRQEMMAKASVLSQSQNDVESLQDQLREEFRKDYVDTGLMSANVLDAELASWNL